MSETKPVRIEIDPSAGFCYGVKKAIARAEEELGQDKLFSLGEIVHNAEEQARLEKTGLSTIDHSSLASMKGKKVLIRAHGEPPSTYETAKNHGVKLVDASCPIVLGIQKKVRQAYAETQMNGGTVLIFGKADHPETVGLAGQTGGNAVIVKNADELHSVNVSKPVYLFAQTTMNPAEYKLLSENIADKMREKGLDPAVNLKTADSICRHVSNREQLLREFARKNELVLFVSGRNSSNGKLLFSYVLQENPNSRHISNPGELDPSWLKGIASIGITGATSTPSWLMEEVKKACGLLASQGIR
ncbi:MAG: 4-hydroxy-3-methylbut-2-enyl diphosphate reductase [Bacteroidales bacterium]